MRCPGRPCDHDGQFCWLDPVDKKHYRLNTIHLRKLVEYVEKDGILETHDDVPYDIRQQIYDEEQERRKKKQKTSSHPETGSTCPPINIHVLPSSSQPLATSHADTETFARKPTKESAVDIPGLLDVAVEEYAKWHLSRVSSEIFKENIRKARDVTLAHCLDLKQIHDHIEPDFFDKEDVKIGAARRWVNDIPLWIQHCDKRKAREEEV